MMFLLETIRLGLANLRLHKLRSMLTALGIICGVFAVIMMIAIGEGNKQAALAKIRQLGARNIIVRSIRPPESDTSQSSRQRMLTYGIKRLDQRRITQSIDDIKTVVALKEVGAPLVRGERKAPGVIFGTTPKLIDVTSMKIERGRYLSANDIDKFDNVAVLGADVASRLFPLEDPLHGKISLGGQVFNVIGVLRPVGLAGGAGSALVGRDLNFDVHIPISTAESRWGDVVIKRSSGSFEGRDIQLSELYLEVKDGADVLAVGKVVRELIDHEHSEQQDVKIIVPLELLEQEKSTRLMQDALLIAIACISLLVGGIGIMNIMLASVTERTREIGIRRAVGATQNHIVMQFLVETTVLSGLGGFMGVMSGVGGAFILGLVHRQIAGIERPQITAWSIAVSFVVATVVGIVFGLYPAVKASQQDPIVALRHD